MEAKFSNRVKEVISLSREEALRLGHDYIGTEHLLLLSPSAETVVETGIETGASFSRELDAQKPSNLPDGTPA